MQIPVRVHRTVAGDGVPLNAIVDFVHALFPYPLFDFFTSRVQPPFDRAFRQRVLIGQRPNRQAARRSDRRKCPGTRRKGRVQAAEHPLERLRVRVGTAVMADGGRQVLRQQHDASASAVDPARVAVAGDAPDVGVRRIDRGSGRALQQAAEDVPRKVLRIVPALQPLAAKAVGSARYTASALRRSNGVPPFTGCVSPYIVRKKAGRIGGGEKLFSEFFIKALSKAFGCTRHAL